MPVKINVSHLVFPLPPPTTPIPFRHTCSSRPSETHAYARRAMPCSSFMPSLGTSSPSSSGD
jgi:hypothetical protein